ncbi:zf-TFIIB domain-containing protein [Nostoc sp.]
MTIQPNCPKCSALMEEFFDDGVKAWECPICDEEFVAVIPY